MKTLLFASIVLALLGQSAPSTPVPALTETQKLQLQNALQQIEIAQLRAQVLLKSLEKEGYTLDLQTLTYTKQSVK